jgi:hypothetical protein
MIIIFIQIGETFQALTIFNEYTIDLSTFNDNAFQILRQRVSNNVQIPFDKDILIKIIDIASFLNISETSLLPLLPYPSLSLDIIEDFIPFIHRLLKYGCPAIAKEWVIQGRLPLSLLHDPTIPYSKFKKAYRDAKLLFEYKVKVLAQCFCPECVNFRSKKKWYDPESNFSEDTYTSYFRFRGNLFKFD